MGLTQKDIHSIRQTIKEEVTPIVTAMTGPSFHVLRDESSQVKENIKNLTEKIDGLVDRSDEFLQIVRRHDQEWLVTRAQHQKLRTALVDKGIVKEDDLALT